MKEKLKTISTLLIIALLFNIIAPAMSVIAAVSGSVTININGPWNVEGTSVDADKNGTVTIDADDVITFTNFDSSKMKAYVEAGDGFNANLTVDENGKTKLSTADCDGLPNATLELKVTSINDGGNGNPPQNDTNKTAAINLEQLTGTYEHIYIDENGTGKTDVENYIPLGSPDGFVDIFINGEPLQPGATEINYYSEDDAATVTFSFKHLWHLRLYDDIIINDGTTDYTYHVADYLDYDDTKQWLDHYNGQIVSVDIDNVPLSNTYAVTVKLGRQWDSHIANFLWTGDPNQADGEDYIGHSHLEMIGLEYTLGDTTYKYTEADFKSGAFNKDYVEYDSDQSLGFDEGSLVIPAGSKVTMRITPEYGYQVLAANLAESGLSTTDSGVCEFSFTIGGGAAYFTADVVAVDDEVKAASDKVSSGNIVLADGSFENGTAVLTVSDVELDSDKIAAFEEEAGEYEIKSYLDIDLDQVFYRGAADSVWSNRIHELDDYATITLQLEDEVDGNDIVIVHNINDGDEFEVINIDSYDPETNTITFKTKSFSNYAIAAKTASATTKETETIDNTETADNPETTDTSDNPKTGDNIITTTDDTKATDTSGSPKTGDNITAATIFVITALTALIAFITLKLNKNRRIREH